MECLHRFCRECIDKSMRLGNNECPSCRTHCASRRSLRDDPNFDALIAALYPDIDKYEDEENALLEEEYRKNQQIQASIAETFRRQSEAVARRRSSSTKATAAAIVRKAHGFRGVQTSRSRGRGRGRGRSQYGPHSRYEDEEDDEDDDDEEEEEEEHDGETTSTEETTRNLGRKRRRPRISLSTENSEEDMSAKLRESGSIRNQDIEYEAKNVAGVANAGYGEAGRSGKGFALDVSSLCSSLLANAAKEKASELHIYVDLRPLRIDGNDQVLPGLERPHLSCPAKMTVHHLLELLQLRLLPRPKGELEVLVEKVKQGWQGDESQQMPPGKVPNGQSDVSADYEVLSPSLLLRNIFVQNAGGGGNLVLLYRLKACRPLKDQVRNHV